MISVSDILNLLDKIPVWKQLKDLPGRTRVLEERVAALESKLSKPPGERCPKCGALAFWVTDSKPDKLAGPVGGIRRTYACSECGFTEIKLVMG